MELGDVAPGARFWSTRHRERSLFLGVFYPAQASELLQLAQTAPSLMVCACSLSEHYKHTLCLTTACFIMPPALLLLARGHMVLGGLAVALCLTSVLYHSTHNLLIRTADVGVAQATVVIGTAIQMGHMWQHGPTGAGIGAIGCELLVREPCTHRTRAPKASRAKTCRPRACAVLLNFHPIFRQRSRPHVLALPGHVAMHAACGGALFLMASA